ncbi:MAG: NAD(P)H-hydrate dehydratase [Verrucomicrobiota bacterium]|nr:NAD(P)H-hydrate dehydratase [Verrucomicrobiota bacterium]
MHAPSYKVPVLSCKQAKHFEASILGDQDSEWSAMKRAGQGIARQLVNDYSELRPAPEYLRVLALIGKGNNAGDALITCGQLLADYPRARVDLILTSPAEELSPLASRALIELEGRVHSHQITSKKGFSDLTGLLEVISDGARFHLCLDGLVGMSFTPPLRSPLFSLIKAVNAFDKIDLRAAIDLPSGRGDTCDEVTFLADFSYATGIAKQPLFTGVADCGRVRYIDLGFFDLPEAKNFDTHATILLDSVLDPIRNFRPAGVDKRKFGHLFILGGSAYMPGALLMAVQAAVCSGVGLVTAFAPASVASALAAQVPEAMWVPWPETNNGTFDPRAMPLLLDRISSASALLVGPGMGRDRYTELVSQEIVKKVECPILLDADALRSRVVEVAQKRHSHYGDVILTPHMGEFLRIAKINKLDDPNNVLLKFSSFNQVITVLKGPVTRVCDGESVVYNTHGGPVLSRGGSGDILAGLISAMIAQNNTCVPTAVARGLMLHGLAAQELARERGQVAVHTTQLLEYLPRVLRA